MDPEELLRIGKIVAAHGIKGEVKVYSYVEQESHLEPGREVFVEPPGSTVSPYKIRGIRVQKKVLCLAFEGVSDRSTAEKLRGAGLYLPRSVLPQPETDAWYWCDLMGLKVYDLKEGFVGRVDSLIETGANDVFVVKNVSSERLIPVVKHVVRHIDLETGRIIVELPEGL